MHRRGDEHALAHLRGALEHGHFEGQGLHAVEQVILAAAVDDMQQVAAHHIMQRGGADACAVDQNFAGMLALVGRHMPQAVLRLDQAFDLLAEHEAHAVDGGMVGEGVGHLVRAGQAGGRRMERAEDVRIGIRLQRKHLVALDEANAGDAVFDALGDEGRQGRAVCLGKAQDERAGLTVGHAKLGAEGRIHLRALDVELCLEGAGMGVKARVDDAAVGLGGALGDIRAAVDNRDARFVPAQHARDGTARDARADDQNVCVHGCISCFSLC